MYASRILGSLIVSHLDCCCFSGRSSVGSPAGPGRTAPATWSTPRRGAYSVPRDHPKPAPDPPARRQAAEVKMVGYITISHGILDQFIRFILRFLECPSRSLLLLRVFLNVCKANSNHVAFALYAFCILRGQFRLNIHGETHDMAREYSGTRLSRHCIAGNAASRFPFITYVRQLQITIRSNFTRFPPFILRGQFWLNIQTRK